MPGRPIGSSVAIASSAAPASSAAMRAATPEVTRRVRWCNQAKPSGSNPSSTSSPGATSRVTARSCVGAGVVVMTAFR